MAVGVILGAAFGKIVESIDNDLVMPIIAAISSDFGFTNLFLAYRKVPPDMAIILAIILAKARKAGVPVFAYGNFLTTQLNFLTLALIIFVMVKQINCLKQEPQPPAPPATAEDIQLLREVRDSLKK